MSISALLPALFPTALLRDAPPQATSTPSRPGSAGVVPDVVVFSSAPMRLLSELASAGLRQLTMLLPALEQAMEERSPVPLGHLAKAAGAAARQMEEGHLALLDEGPDRVQASLTGEVRARAAASPDQAAQLLRTLVRQIGSSIPEAPEANASTGFRTMTRQGGGAGLPERGLPELGLPQLGLTQPGLSRHAPPAGKQDAAAEPALQLLRTLARQIGSFTPPHTETRTGETGLDLAKQVDEAPPPAERPATDPASPARRWLDEAQHLLHRTGEALDQAGEQLRPMIADVAAPSPQAGWALAQIVAAQAQLASAVTCLGRTRVPASSSGVRWTRPSVSVSLAQLGGAASLAGMVLLLGLLWIGDSLWALAMGLAGLVATAVWAFRIGRAARGVALDGRS